MDLYDLSYQARGGGFAGFDRAFHKTLPIGQMLWFKELMSYKEFPPLQAPETYNLEGIMKQVEKSAAAGD